MFLLVCRAYLLLLRIDTDLIHGGFPALHERVQNVPLRSPGTRSASPEAICRAVDVASVWYLKQVPCLQRSAAATCLLRQCGVAAELVLGVQLIPFRGHAWVEVKGRVVNDKPYICELYEVMDRC
jgi:hypothetical protein